MNEIEKYQEYIKVHRFSNETLLSFYIVERRYDMIDAISLIREMDDPFNIEISMIEEAVDFFRDNYDWNYPARNQLKRALITVLEENHII